MGKLASGGSGERERERVRGKRREDVRRKKRFRKILKWRNREKVEKELLKQVGWWSFQRERVRKSKQVSEK